MSNLYLCPDDFWRCPIDLNHQVLAKRFQYHIRRCTIANPHIRRVRCVFNANHLTTPDDLLHHMSTCPDAISTSTVLIGLSDIPPGKPWSDNCIRSSAPTDWQMFHDVTATEDWDDDIRERRTKAAQLNEQAISSPSSIQSSISPSNVERSDEKQQQQKDNLDDTKPTKSSNVSVTLNRRAHLLKKHDKNGSIHSVETDEITKDLMKIRTLQLIGGAGRGACCLLPNTSPAVGFSSNKQT